MICTAMYLHIIWIWASCGGAQCRGVLCGRARHRTVWTMSGGRTMCCRISRSFSRHGLSGARFGRMLSNPAIRGFLRMPCSSARYNFHWCTTTECSGGGCHIMHSGETISPDCGCSCRKQRPLCNVIWRLRLRVVRFHRVMLAPVMWRPDASDSCL